MGLQLPFTAVTSMEDVQANMETITQTAAPAIGTGLATLAAGTVAVPAPQTTVNTIVRCSSKHLGGTPGALFVSSKTAGTGFTITSTSGTDTSTVFYEIVAW